MQRDAVPGETLHVRHPGIVIEVGAVVRIFLNNGEDARWRLVPAHAARYRRAVGPTASVIHGDLLRLDRDDRHDRLAGFARGRLASSACRACASLAGACAVSAVARAIDTEYTRHRNRICHASPCSVRVPTAKSTCRGHQLAPTIPWPRSEAARQCKMHAALDSKARAHVRPAPLTSSSTHAAAARAWPTASRARARRRADQHVLLGRPARELHADRHARSSAWRAAATWPACP